MSNEKEVQAGSPLLLPWAPRAALAVSSTACFLLAGASELWRHSDGVGVVALVASGTLSGTLSAIGKIPSKIWFKNEGAIFAAEVEREQKTLEEIVSEMPHDQALSMLLARVESSSTTTAAAAARVLKHVTVEEKAGSIVEKFAKKYSLKFFRDAYVLADKSSSNNSVIAGKKIPTDFLITMPEGRQVAIEVKSPSSTENSIFTVRRYVENYLSVAPSESVLIMALPIEAAAHAGSMFGKWKIEPGSRRKIAFASWEDGSLEAALQQLLDGKEGDGFHDGVWWF